MVTDACRKVPTFLFVLILFQYFDSILIYHQENMFIKCIPRKTPLFAVKLGFAGLNLFFSPLIQNIDCGYSLEPPRRGGSNVYPQSIF